MDDLKNIESIPRPYRGSPNRNRNNKDWFSINTDRDNNYFRGDERDPSDLIEDSKQVKQDYEKYEH